MADYKKMYYLLFNKISDVIRQLEDIQKMAEEIFIETGVRRGDDGEKNISVIPSEEL